MALPTLKELGLSDGRRRVSDETKQMIKELTEGDLND